MKKNFIYLAMAACVALCNLSCSGSDDDGGSQNPINPLEYASKAVAFQLSDGDVTATAGSGASLTALNFTEAGKAIIEITENGKKKFVTYNVKIEGNTYTITNDNGQQIGVVTSDVTRGTKPATINVNITVTINGVTYVFNTNSVEADMQYATMTGGDNLVNIARTWKVRNMKLTLESDDTTFPSLSMTENSGKLSAFVNEVKKRDTGFSNEDIDKLNKEIKSVTLDQTGMFDIEYTDGRSDVATWRWANGNYSNIALELKDSEAGNRFIQDNTKITVAFNEGLCRFTLVTTIERDNKQPFVGTLNIVLEQK
jgi:hypothetical protein